MTGGYSLVAVQGLLIAVVSLVAEHGLWGLRASVVAALGLWSTDSVVVVPRLSSPTARELFPDQGPNRYPLHCKADS